MSTDLTNQILLKTHYVRRKNSFTLYINRGEDLNQMEFPIEESQLLSFEFKIVEKTLENNLKNFS